MHKRVATWMTVTVGLLVILLPTLAALYLVHHQSMDEESARASTMATKLLQRADVMGAQTVDSYRALQLDTLDDPCSDKALALMRDLGLKSDYLQAVGYADDGHLICSSFGRYGGKGLDLGPVSYASDEDTRIRTSVDLGLGDDRRYLIIQRGHFVVAIHPATLLGVIADNADTSFGIYGATSRQPMAKQGEFNADWTKQLGSGHDTVFFDGKFLVAIKHSTKLDIAAYVAVPVANLTARMHRLAMILLPLGLLLGLGLFLVVLFLARQQNSLPAILRTALKQHEFTLYYQPIVALESGRMVGVEALLRWPRTGQPGIGPGLFIPVAEECGLIGKFTRYVFERIATDAPAYIARHPGCYISINLSSADLHTGEIVARLADLVTTPGIAATNIMVELTEHSFLNTQLAAPTIEQIRALGIRVAIDDFGTGFANLAHLTTLKIDCLKIDRVFVEAVGTQSVTSQVALHIIGVGRELGLTVIAEGIETEMQARFLREHGVAYGQGWLFEKAAPLDALLRSWRFPGSV